MMLGLAIGSTSAASFPTFRPTLVAWALATGPKPPTSVSSRLTNRIQLHELLTYLGQRSIATILIGAHQGMIGAQMHTPVDASYLADAVVLLHYFEAKGEVRQAISVMKKRGSKHERTIREFRLDAGRISVGEALREFRGILTGVPVYEGPSQPPDEKPV